MEHIKDIELIELAARRLEAGRENIILVHLQSCPRCCARLAEIRQTWDVLGAWQVESQPRLDTQRICARAAQAAERQPKGTTIRLLTPGTLLRVAASIATAALVGYMGGHWSARQAKAPSPPQSPSYVSALGLEVGESLSSLVLDEEPVAGEGS